MDGSGLAPLLKLLSQGVQVKYASFTRSKRLKSVKLSESRRKLVATAINRGQLEEVKVSEAIKDCDRIIVSYVTWLNSDIDRRDLVSVYREICDLGWKPELHLIQTGVHELGLMDRIVGILEREGRRPKLFYLPLTSIFRRRIPIAGPPVDGEVRPIISALTGRRQLFPGLSYVETEAATLTRLLIEAASYGAAVELALILYRRYGVLHSESLRHLIGRAGMLPWHRRMGAALLMLLEELEGAELQKSLIAGAVSKVMRESNKVLSSLLTERLKSKRSARILLIDVPAQKVDKLRRNYRVIHLTRSEFLSRKLSQKIEAAVLASDDREVIGLLKNLVSDGGVVIDLSSFRCIRFE